MEAKYSHKVTWEFLDKNSWCCSTWSAPLGLKYYCWIIILTFSYMLLVCWPTLDIWQSFLQLWGLCDTDNIFGGNNPQTFAHILHLSFFIQVYILWVRNKFVCVPSTLSLNPWYSLTISLSKSLIQNGMYFGFLLSVYIPWIHLCPHQQLHWPFWLDNVYVCLVGCL